jgi:hypothetical protein
MRAIKKKNLIELKKKIKKVPLGYVQVKVPQGAPEKSLGCSFLQSSWEGGSAGLEAGGDAWLKCRDYGTSNDVKQFFTLDIKVNGCMASVSEETQRKKNKRVRERKTKFDIIILGFQFQVQLTKQTKRERSLVELHPIRDCGRTAQHFFFFSLCSFLVMRTSIH